MTEKKPLYNKKLMRIIKFSHYQGGIPLTELSEALNIPYRTIKYWKSNSFYLREELQSSVSDNKIFKSVLIDTLMS